MNGWRQLALTAVGAAGMMLAASGASIFVECESFRNLGGWTNDTQFMDQMGSPYLLAHGLGHPVADASTLIDIPEAGSYTLWVRTMNWTGRWTQEAAGLFEVRLRRLAVRSTSGHSSSPFGSGSADWTWQKGGTLQLHKGRYSLSLHDLTGFDGRCDAIMLTTEEKPDFAALRRQAQDVASAAMAKEDQLRTYDLCVVGGGIAGICTAVSAARLGLKVALVQDRPLLGGNNSSEVRVHLGARQNTPPYPRLGDVVAEIGPQAGGNARAAAQYEDDRKLAVVKAEPNLDLFLNEHVNAVYTNAARRIEAVGAVHTRTLARRRFKARYFADCTGDGTVGFLAGADWRQGREGRGETGEPSAPEKADTLTMGASVQWYAEPTDRPVDFPVRPWMLRNFTDENCSPHLRGDWWWEAGLGRDQIAEGEYIRDYGLLVAFSNWAFVKNASTNRAEFAQQQLAWVAFHAGRRESRRLLGDFILDQHHLRSREVQVDGTCAATWTIDLHEPKSAAETKFAGEPYQANSLQELIWPYPIPYRCFYSRNVPNLFMAGRDISVTHVALGTTRLMRTHGMMGEVVGMAASLCHQHNCDPRDIYTAHLDELKALMTKGVGKGLPQPPQRYNLGGTLAEFDIIPL